MRHGNAPDREPPIFSAVITPHRSLTPSGFVALMVAVSLVSFVAGLICAIAGAWPITGFFGLDVVLIYGAFRLNYRDARAYEEVWVSPSELLVRKVDPKGAVAEWSANPLWVRIDREIDEDYGLQRLFLVTRGRRLAVASCLAPEEKASFARALSSALGEARRGPMRNAV